MSFLKVFFEDLNYLIFLHILMFLLNFYHPKLDYFVDRIYAVLFFVSLTTLMCTFFSFQIKINWTFISFWFICFYIYVIINHVSFIQFNLHFNSNLNFFLKIIIVYLCLKLLLFILKEMRNFLEYRSTWSSIETMASSIFVKPSTPMMNLYWPRNILLSWGESVRFFNTSRRQKNQWWLRFWRVIRLCKMLIIGRRFIRRWVWNGCFETAFFKVFERNYVSQ